jgi:hypothetical protein
MTDRLIVTLGYKKINVEQAKTRKKGQSESLFRFLMRRRQYLFEIKQEEKEMKT